MWKSPSRNHRPHGEIPIAWECLSSGSNARRISKFHAPYDGDRLMSFVGDPSEITEEIEDVTLKDQYGVFVARKQGHFGSRLEKALGGKTLIFQRKPKITGKVLDRRSQTLSDIDAFAFGNDSSASRTGLLGPTETGDP
jgi:hypothetical protein